MGLVLRRAAGGQQTLAQYPWQPIADTGSMGPGWWGHEATIDLEALDAAAGDRVLMQVLFESATDPEAFVIEAFPSMEIPGYQQ